ncbi:Uncharacterized protein FWK35_00015203 [Aphis craccivora]|uniref:Uncharacterized protein n=1 Tax=Aphis craccivora TaxID=307492 RepID=A0A6G0Z8A8_APHCR|nr:Uncharacterized protein FWK35_00015203 [Aphis craccivora]
MDSYYIIKSEASAQFLNSYSSITSRNNAPVSNYGGGFRFKSEYHWCIIEVKSKHFPTVFKKIEKNKKKMTEKREFYAKPLKKFKLLRNLLKMRKITMRLNFKFLRNSSKSLAFSLLSIKLFWTYQKTRKFNTKFLIIQILTKIRQIPEYLQIIL